MASADVDTAPASSSSLSQLLETIQSSLSSAISSLPSVKPLDESSDADLASIVPPADGISLLDTKSEILLSYLQNLVFLILLQVRQLSASTQPDGTAQQDTDTGSQVLRAVTQKLVELRVYLERGVRPLEGKLKYQIDKVLKAAEDQQRQQQQQQQQQQKAKKSRQDRDGSESEGSRSGSDDESGSHASSDEGSEEVEEEEEEEDQDVDELAYRPNLAAFSRAAQEEAKAKATAKSTTSTDGIYRPPKIKPTALPPLESDRRPREERRQKSRLIDEFVQAEMSSAPMVEPSIGSTIRAGGRVMKTQRDREKEAERTEYEETNLVRLPKESKKERAKRARRERLGFGGEDWQSLGEGADRIQRLTKRSRESGGVLERSRKRKATEDGPRSDGVNVGEIFEQRRKKVATWKR
ncbi:hypothetical protein VTO42DRAFT_739 [Malbranchea cinnamomea]